VVQPSLEPASEPSGVPIIFGPSGHPLTGFYHPPAGPQTRSAAVVLVDPLGYESMSVHRTYWHLAGRLAAEGFPVLRFDHEGAGDSPAEMDAPGRVPAWIAGIRAAVAEVRARSGVDRIALLGVRFGGTLALRAALELGEPGLIDALIAWGPVVSGRVHVRELRAFRMLQGSKEAAPADGSEEIGGHFFAKETLYDMSAIDLLALKDLRIRRALILASTERRADETRLTDHLKAGGTHTDLRTDPAFAKMMRDDPYDAVVPFATLDAVVAWLSEGSPLESRVPTAPGPAAGSLSLAAREGSPAMRETPLLFGEEQRLFGVLTEPTDPAARDRPVVCFLNVGSNSHVGPHRMNVELARDLAAQGYLTFRFDVSGLGDSGILPGKAENRIYTLDSVGDVKSAMDLLGQIRSASRFVLVGLCSGAYAAYHTAVADSRVVGQVLLSPYAFEWKEGDPVTPVSRPLRSTRGYARAIFDKAVWLKALRGDVHFRLIAGILLVRARESLDGKLTSLSAFLRRRRRPQSEVERQFRSMGDRGLQSLVVLSFNDGGLDMIARYLGTDASRMRGEKQFVLEILQDGDHTFTNRPSRLRLREILRTYLGTRFN